MRSCCPAAHVLWACGKSVRCCNIAEVIIRIQGHSAGATGKRALKSVHLNSRPFRARGLRVEIPLASLKAAQYLQRWRRTRSITSQGSKATCRLKVWYVGAELKPRAHHGYYSTRSTVMTRLPRELFHHDYQWYCCKEQFEAPFMAAGSAGGYLGPLRGKVAPARKRFLRKG